MAGEFQLEGDSFLLHTDGKFAVHEDCCCGDPCWTPPQGCAAAQVNDVTVTTTAGPGLCQMDGVYVWNTYFTSEICYDGYGCTWSWSAGDPLYARAWICYDQNTGVWSAALHYHGVSCPYHYRGTNLTGFSCDPETGVLSGEDTIDGQDCSGYGGDVDCSDYTATISIGS